MRDAALLRSMKKAPELGAFLLECVVQKSRITG
jgi:hypothetical protein